MRLRGCRTALRRTPASPRPFAALAVGQRPVTTAGTILRLPTALRWVPRASRAPRRPRLPRARTRRRLPARRRTRCGADCGAAALDDGHLSRRRAGRTLRPLIGRLDRVLSPPRREGRVTDRWAHQPRHRGDAGGRGAQAHPHRAHGGGRPGSGATTSTSTQATGGAPFAHRGARARRAGRGDPPRVAGAVGVLRPTATRATRRWSWPTSDPSRRAAWAPARRLTSSSSTGPPLRRGAVGRCRGAYSGR